MNRINDILTTLEANAEKPKKKIIRKKVGTKERFIRIIQSQGDDIIKHWYSNKKKKELYIEFEKVNADIDIGDIIHEIYNEFVEILGNLNISQKRIHY